MSIHNLSNHIYSPSELMREHPYFFSIRELLMNSCKIRKRSDFIISFFCYNIDKPSKEMDIEIIMQSNILLFLFFSIIAALIIRFLPPSRKKYGLFCLNIIFYLLCDARFIILILISTLWSFFCGRRLQQANIRRKFWLCLGIVPVIFVLAFFKYYKFFIPNIHGALVILMPLGISYYTFKIISYVADIYLGKRDAEPSFINYCIYVSFFPQIICGPISRSGDITGQIEHLANPSLQMLTQGYLLILSGLFKKLVIADRLNPYVNTIFADSSSYPALALWMAAFFYTIQIYCDFAGYSEIAIGVSHLLGFECKPNFHLPYFSSSIKDFWRRWHISLSSWLRDYIYIPLGGNQKGLLRKDINILITFLVSGLWHGTGLNYICWGLWHGLLNLLPIKKATNKGLYFLQILFNFICVMFGWILFRAGTLKQALLFIQQMFMQINLSIPSIISAVIPFTGDYSCLAYLLTVCMFILILFLLELRDFSTSSDEASRHPYFKCLIYLLGIILFGMIGQNSFLYANF